MRATQNDRARSPKRQKSANTKRKTKTQQKKKSYNNGFFWLRRLAYGGALIGLWSFILLAFYVAYCGLKLPHASIWEVPTQLPNIAIYDANGALIANRGIIGGQSVALNNMSPWIAKTVIAVEDRRFYDHHGVDLIGIGRAAFNNLLHIQTRQGGSTLTQQLAKNLFLTPNRTLERKVQEILLALWLEQKYSKAQILELYLNRVYLGANTYGVEAASRRYFHKTAKQLDPMEAAIMTGLFQAPSRLSPARNPQAAYARATRVLAMMEKENMITAHESQAAQKKWQTQAPTLWFEAENYVADNVMAKLPFLLGKIDRNINVETTIDMQLQRSAEYAIKQQIKNHGHTHDVSQGALISIDKTGAIKALIGGEDYGKSQYNRAVEAKRQPGSAFKTFVYLAAIEAGLTPNTVRDDVPIQIGSWAPHNFKQKYNGAMTLSAALSRSSNSIATQLIMEVGPNKVREIARRLGIHSWISNDASIALGTSEVSLIEMTQAFLPLVNGGYRPPQLQLITKITDDQGKVLYRFDHSPAKRVISPRTVSMVNAMLEQSIKTGTAKGAAIGRPAAGKTGTSQDFRDAWFIGYTANYATGIWFGNDDGQPMKNVTGSTLPVAAWAHYMQRAEYKQPIMALFGSAPAHNKPGNNNTPAAKNKNVPYASEFTSSIHRQ